MKDPLYSGKLVQVGYPITLPGPQGPVIITATTTDADGYVTSARIAVANAQGTLPGLPAGLFQTGCILTNTAGTDVLENILFVNTGTIDVPVFAQLSISSTAVDAIIADNSTGGPVVAGTLVRLSSAINNNQVVPAFTLASASGSLPATHVVTTGIPDGQTGPVAAIASLTGLNTNGQSTGNPVYLSSAGGFTFTAPTGADQISQIVGAVTNVGISNGGIYFFPGTRQDLQIGTSVLQNQAVTSPKIAESVVQSASIPLTKANILAMNGAPVTVIAAPGATKVLEFVSCLIEYDYSTATYGGGGAVTFAYSGAATVSNAVSAANSFGSGASVNTVCVQLDTANGIVCPKNTALVITNATGAFTDPGTAAGTAVLHITYRVHTVSN